MMFAWSSHVLVFVQSEHHMPNEFLLDIVTLVLNGSIYNFRYFQVIDALISLCYKGCVSMTKPSKTTVEIR
jgi:hypothetical protein